MKKKEVFDPVKKDQDGKLARRVIWNTVSLDLAIKGLEEGRKLVANPFYENNTRLLKGDLVFERTEDEIEEWKRCREDIIYFVEKYCKIMTPEGIKNVTLRDYQVEYLKHLENNRLSILLSARQAGKTVTSSLFMLHYILFNIDKNALVLGNKLKTAKEVLDKAKKIFIEIPYFLRPGVYKWNETEVVLDNGCRLMAEATTINSGISFTFHCVLADEFAHVSPNILDKFYNNLFPTITAGRARFMITSTQNGYNLFYKLYSAAVNGENDYAPFEVSWDRIPEWNPETRSWEKRDEEWHRRQVANYGSEEAFNAQFGTNFDVSASTLISQKILTSKRKDLVQFMSKDIPGVPLSEFFLWHPEYEPTEQLKKDSVVITCDIAEGIGKDYTVFMINRLINPGTSDTECIGMFRCNSRDRGECATALQLLCMYYLNPDRFLLSLEYNTYGELFIQSMYTNMEKIPEIMNNFDPSCLVKYYNESGTRYLNGIKLTSGNKTSHCLLFKEGYEKGIVKNECAQFMTELDKFCDDGSNHFKSSYGHDDMVMAQVQLEFAKKTLQYKMLRDEFDSGLQPTNEFIYNPFESYTYNGEDMISDYYSRLNT